MNQLISLDGNNNNNNGGKKLKFGAARVNRFCVCVCMVYYMQRMGTALDDLLNFERKRGDNKNYTFDENNTNTTKPHMPALSVISILTLNSFQ